MKMKQQTDHMFVGYTPITPEIKQSIKNLLSNGYTKNSLAHELNIGCGRRTTAINKILGTTGNPGKLIRLDVLKKIQKLEKQNGLIQ